MKKEKNIYRQAIGFNLTKYKNQLCVLAMLS